MGFDDRLKAAILRGQRRGDAAAHEAAAQAMSEEDFRRLHSQVRLKLSDHIEACVNKLPNFFPGFQYEMMYGDRGWGGACFREDLRLARGQRTNEYSRLEVTVRPYSAAHVLDLAAKGTIRNKEVFNRNYYEELADADAEKFRELIDLWVLEYAELYASRGG
ncbi:MAG: hypothetical protein L0211_20530 [Planctomycetaceae bacterium]|nr:hypothetical protein [Planctomycetaceae bacterium]